MARPRPPIEPETRGRVTRSAAKRIQEESAETPREPEGSLAVVIIFFAIVAFHGFLLAGLLPENPALISYQLLFLSWLRWLGSRGSKVGEYVMELPLLNQEELKLYIAELKSTHGAGTVYAVAGVVCVAMVLVLAVPFIRIIVTEGTRGGKGAKRSRKEVAVVLSGDVSGSSELELDDESFLYDDGEEDETPKEELKGPDVVYVKKKLTPEEYEKEKERATSREVAALLRSSEFRQLMKERGADDSAFNWQKRERALKKSNAGGSPKEQAPAKSTGKKEPAGGARPRR